MGILQRKLLRGAARIAAMTGTGDLAYRLLATVRRLRHPSVYLRNRRLRIQGAPDGLPIPPDHHLYLAGGMVSISSFLQVGQLAAKAIEGGLAEVGRDLESFENVLDFGCGCGRVLRHWKDLEGTNVSGCDYNPRLISWVQENLPFVDARVNAALPPLPYEDDSFDFIYALSVFTHLTEPGQRAWMDELRRVLRSDGIFLVTVHGARFARLLLTEAEQERFRSGELVVTNRDLEGSNVCAAFHPPGYVRKHLAQGFDVLSYQPEEARGNGLQDQYLLRPS